MNAYWAQFAKTGDPNGAMTDLEWPAFEPDEEEHNLRLQFDPEAVKVAEDFRYAECQLWREYNAERPKARSKAHRPVPGRARPGTGPANTGAGPILQ